MFSGGDVNIIEQQMQRLFQLMEQGAPVQEIEAARFELEESMRQQPFEMKQQLPRFLDLARKLDARIPFQQFRLPGTDRLVVDRREAPTGEPKVAAKEEAVREAVKEAGKGAAKEADKDAAKEAKKAEADHRAGEAKRAEEGRAPDKTGRAGLLRGGLEQETASERVERMLSAFERMVLERFERGRTVAKECDSGRPKFLQKGGGEWKEFFRTFLHRTVARKALISDIRDFLFRGVVARGNKGVFIGDMNMAGGRVEKFVRFSILAEALAKLRNLMPGSAVGKETLLGGLSSEELLYLALAASRARKFAGSKQDEQGKFISGRAEAQAAEALGLPLETQLREKARRLKKGRGGLFAGDLLGEEGPADEVPYQFVPWWQWGNLSRPGRFRWLTVVFYTSLLVICLIGVAALTYKLLGG